MTLWENYTPSNQSPEINIKITAAINVSGGDAYDGTNEGVAGGDGGEVYFEPYDDLTNNGKITANGGTNDHISYFGNRGGNVYFYSYEGNITNTTTISVNGTNADVFGSSGGYINLDSNNQPLTNSGALNAWAGNGGEFGSNGGFIQLNGQASTNSSSINVNGSVGSDPVTAYGGNSGFIDIFNNDGFFGLSNTGNLSYSKGKGTTEDGFDGCARLNYVEEGNCS